jgi:hypothetical protein
MGRKAKGLGAGPTGSRLPEIRNYFIIPPKFGNLFSRWRIGFLFGFLAKRFDNELKREEVT